MMRVLAILIAGTAARLSAQGTLNITVVDGGSSNPISQAQIGVVTTTLGGLTGADGKLVLRNVPLGPQTIRVLRVGYAEQKKSVTIVAGATQTLSFVLVPVAVNLTPVVTTATGETRRVEIGNATSSIDVSKVMETAPVTSLNDLLSARAPGVYVTQGTQTGSGARIRIRGTSSLSLGNDPIYIIDGVRMSSNVGSIAFGTGGALPNRTGDINPDEIENIEIVKGPSAETLYGTDATNGVIVITTKKGRAGAARWNVFGESGMMSDRNTYPYNFTIAGHSPGQTAYRECALPTISAGTCQLDSVRVYAPLHDPNATPLGVGYRGTVGASVSGGTEAVRYAVSVQRENEVGVLKLPEFEATRFAASNTVIHDWTQRPNMVDKTSVRANVNMALSSQLDVGVSMGFTTLGQRYSLESNATAGLGSQVFGGKGYKANGTVAVTGTPLNGYRAWTPGYTWQEKTAQGVDRFIGGINVNWRPTSWLQNRMDFGTDLTDRVDVDLRLRGEGPPLTSTYRDGYAGNGRANIRNFTTNLSSTATWNVTSGVSFKTTAGIQYVDFKQDGNTATGTTLPIGAQTANAGATLGASESTTLRRTIGLYVEESAAINDRLFITAAVRSDQNSAFGTEFQNVMYPKLQGSWILSDEPWFHAPRWLDNLRLRLAYGAAGVQPGSNDALRTFSATTPNIQGVDVPAVVYSTPGNVALKPEFTDEYETGFEARFWKGRASIDLTYYSKRTKDALISAIVAPSAGASTTVRMNLGAVTNTGWEMLLTGQLIDTRNFGLDVTVNAAYNENKLLSLGGTPPQIGTQTRVIENYPLFGLWARQITGWQDKNNDKILTYSSNPTANEVFVDTAATFMGYSAPHQSIALTTGMDLFNRRVRVTALMDYRGGNKYYNNTERIRCVSRQNCEGLMNPNASFEDQAMVVATLNDPSQTIAGFFQPGDFVKLREVSATYNLTQAQAARFKMRNASLTLSARNLWKWTKYRGVDPESDYTVTDGTDNPSDFQTMGAPTYFILKFNLGF